MVHTHRCVHFLQLELCIGTVETFGNHLNHNTNIYGSCVLLQVLSRRLDLCNTIQLKKNPFSGKSQSGCGHFRVLELWEKSGPHTRGHFLHSSKLLIKMSIGSQNQEFSTYGLHSVPRHLPTFKSIEEPQTL